MATTVQSISPSNSAVVTPAANDGTAATATATPAPQASFTDSRALRSVTGTDNVGLSGLTAPAVRPMRIAQADNTDVPPANDDDGDDTTVPPSDDVPAPAPMTLKERQDYISDLTTAILQGRAEAVDTEALETQLNEALWDPTLSREDKHTLALWLSSTQIVTPDGDEQFMDKALDEALDGAAWRSFSFFMYEYTAGFGDNDVPPVIVDGGYDAPPWWYDSRPYDTYTPYWEYRLPDTCPFPTLPVVVIEIPGRGHYHGPFRDHEWHFPRNRGDHFPRTPHGHLPNPRTPVPRPPHFPDHRGGDHHGPRDPRDPRGPRDPNRPHIPHGPRIPGEPPRGPHGPDNHGGDHRPPPGQPQPQPQPPRGPRVPGEPPRGPHGPDNHGGDHGGDHHPPPGQPPRGPQQPQPQPPQPQPPRGPQVPHGPDNHGGDHGGDHHPPPGQPPRGPQQPPQQPPRQPPQVPHTPPPAPPPHRTEPPRQPPQVPHSPPPAPPRAPPPPPPRAPAPIPRAPAPPPRAPSPPPAPRMPPPPPPRAPAPPPAPRMPPPPPPRAPMPPPGGGGGHRR